ncbi:hypothetical protein IL252_14290 (plasmid) [Halomicrobium sp. IBSBa]|uniref:hypothetical protein n=1 Tax=Halomicrobium sp. IBSBa TaxID=2778916 RepID=UPI001ABF4DC5|nr:hypothetical protein [Halomicrobium sp. IBSBa]MBO4248988.1 hypothetical protein [Halomicrobium sp. IBSBa]
MIQMEDFATAEKEEVEGRFDLSTTAVPPIQIAKEFLPSRGRYLRAWYRIAVTIDPDSAKEKSELTSPQIAIKQLWGDVWKKNNKIYLYSNPESEDVRGYLNLEPFMLSWTQEKGMERLPAECQITLEIEYDPGKTLNRTSYKEVVREADPEIGYRTEFSETGITVDYRGQIQGGDWDHRLPMDIKYAYPVDDGLLVMLQKGTGGVIDPNIECVFSQNILKFDSRGDIKWRAQPTKGDDDEYTHYRYLWRYDDRLMTRTAAQSYVELDPETGSVVQNIPRYTDQEET